MATTPAARALPALPVACGDVHATLLQDLKELQASAAPERAGTGGGWLQTEALSPCPTRVAPVVDGETGTGEQSCWNEGKWG